MPFIYTPSQPVGELRQGEILSGMYDLQVCHEPIAPVEDGDIPVDPVLHPLVLVMTADCDLLQDYQARANLGEKRGEIRVDRDEPGLLPYVLLCDLFLESELKSSLPQGSEIWRRVRQNQNERYHHLASAWIGLEADQRWLPHLYMDFKKILATPPQWLYRALDKAAIKREAVIPSIHLQRTMQRFYAFQARVGEPE